MITIDPAQDRPWYREHWVWLLMVPPAAAVLGGLTMVYLAASAPAALVVDDYARIEEITEQRFARDARAAELGVRADLRFDVDASGRTQVVVALAADAPLPSIDSLQLRLLHATNRNADRALVLTRAGSYFTAQTELSEGRHRVELLAPDDSWRLAGSLTRVPGTLALTTQTD